MAHAELDARPRGQSVQDPRRLAALAGTGLLDSGPEVDFDRLTRLVALMLDVPMATVSLVDAERQFFKSCFGLPEPVATQRQTSLSQSLCKYVVAGGASLAVCDVRHDPRFRASMAENGAGLVAYLGVPLFTAGGDLLGSLCGIDVQPRDWTGDEVAALHDLATLVSSEIALRQRLSQLDAADASPPRDHASHDARLRQLGQLAAGIAHDMRNVLQAISGNVALAGRRLETDLAGAARLLGAIHRAAERGAAISNRVVSFAASAAPARLPVPPRAMFETVRSLLEHRLADVEVVIDCAEDLPPPLAREYELETVLVNLALNARDAMPQGGRLRLAGEAATVPSGSGRVGDVEPGAYCVLSVADTGDGMSPDVLRRVSEPFFTTKGGQGTGLGLAMARDFAEEAGGALEISSEHGQGTTVALWLPVAQ